MTAKPKPILDVAFENAISAACRPMCAGSLVIAAMAKSRGESLWEDAVFFLMREKPL